MDPMSAAIQSRGMVLMVLVVLVLLSVASWVVIGSRAWALRNLRREVAIFRTQFSELVKTQDLAMVAEQLAKRYLSLPHTRLLASVLKELSQLEASGTLREEDLSSIERALKRTAEPLVDDLESGLQLLATTATAAPFIGLFGTVWGIYHALLQIASSGQVMIDKVAGPVGEALIMTAAGLAVAIPAVLAYNAFTRTNRVVMAELDGFAHDLHALVTTGQRLESGTSDGLRSPVRESPSALQQVGH